MTNGEMVPAWLGLLFLILIVVFLCFLYFQPLTVSPRIEKLRAWAKKIAPEFSGTIFEANESFSQNKEKIFICLQDKSDQALLIILLHELAHCLVTSQGHDDAFNQKFLELVERTQRFGFVFDWHQLDIDLKTR